MVPDNGFNLGRRPIVADDHGDVALDRWEAADGLDANRPLLGRVQATDRQLGDHDAPGPQFPRLQRVWMELGNAPADHLTTGPGLDNESPAWVERETSGVGNVGGSRQMKPAAKELDDTLGVVQIVRRGRPVPCRWQGVARQQEGEPGPLARGIPNSTVAFTNLEDGQILPTLAFVESQHAEQTTDEMLTQHRVLAR